jgi:hypothetical protein
MVGAFDDFAGNKLSIITFNYDRSLEQFFFSALLHRFGRNEWETAEAISHIPVIHVHGHLGELPWKADRAGEIRPYTNELTAETLRIASQSIKIIHEDIDNTAEFERARSLIQGAQRLFFLGFGYHPKNLQRLGFVLGRPAGAGWPYVSGTWQGMTRPEHTRIQQMYPVCRFEQLPPEAADIMGLMRHDPWFLNITG